VNYLNPIDSGVLQPLVGLGDKFPYFPEVGGGGASCTVMEAAKGIPYRMAWQVLLMCKLLSTLAAEI
jgi:hypothetical protein